MKNLKQEKPITVLIVEDDVIQTLLLKTIITKLGFQVIGKVTSGEQAIKAALENSPDIITMDIFLEGNMDGISAVEEINKHHQIPVIYISANSDKENFERAKKTNYVDFLSKPINNNLLTETLTLISNSFRLNRPQVF